MRYFSMFFVIVAVFILALTFASFAAAEPLTPRPVDPLAAETFARGREQSAVVRALVATLEASNVLVHIETSRSLPLGIGGTTRFVVSRGGYRYVRIQISTELSKSARVAILGHELQHACEVAESRADDVTSIQQLFAKVGHLDGAYYETAAAQRIEDSIRGELRALSARSALPGK